MAFTPQRVSKPVTTVTKIADGLPHPKLPAIGPELDKALDEFVADKPKPIMKE